MLRIPRSRFGLVCNPAACSICLNLTLSRVPCFDGQPVDLGGEDEVVLRESANGMRRKLDPDPPIPFQMEIGVMPFRLGQLGYPPKKSIPARKSFISQSLRMRGPIVREPPVCKRAQPLANLGWRIAIRRRFAQAGG